MDKKQTKHYAIGFLLMMMLSIMSPPSQAQTTTLQFRVFSEVDSNGKITFFAHNPFPCPYQVKIDSEDAIKLLDVEQGLPFFALVPANTERFRLFAAMPEKSKQSIKYRFSFEKGNPETANPNLDYPYLLPYLPKRRIFVSQGFNGHFSHQNQFALDFKMKEGSPICAARDGIVHSLKQDSNEGGKTKHYARLANFVIIYHPSDGTFAYYYHLQQNSVKVKVGERVNAGQVIAASGNTGWSTTPHLHFVVKRPAYLTMRSVPVKFLRKKGKVKRLKAWRCYRAFHPR